MTSGTTRDGKDDESLPRLACMAAANPGAPPALRRGVIGPVLPPEVDLG